MGLRYLLNYPFYHLLIWTLCTWPDMSCLIVLTQKINTLEFESKYSPSCGKSTKCASQFDLQLTRDKQKLNLRASISVGIPNISHTGVSAKLANTPIWEIFGIPADTFSNLTLFSPLSISGQIDWHTWLTFRDSANTCPRISVCWFLRQQEKSRWCQHEKPQVFRC